jgi:hypothetical protein
MKTQSAITTARTAIIINAVASGASLATSYESVMGEGEADSLVAAIMAALRAKRATPTTEAAK